MSKRKSDKVSLGAFVENPDNPSVASDEDIQRLADKLRRVPLGLTAMRIAYVTDRADCGAGKRVVISGNKRLRVLKRAYGENGEVPAEWFADVTAMTEEQRREFIVTANVSDGEWDVDKLLDQFGKDELSGWMKKGDVDELLEYVSQHPELRVTDDDGRPTEGDTQEYVDFVDKFKAKHTTDDCYTPPNIYEAVLHFVEEHYGVLPRDVVRPFKPGGDYQAEKYSASSVVVDNPPFSILSDICRWYRDRGIKFFLFCPALTSFCCSGEFNTLSCGVSITYANGAKVETNFITNMGEYLIETTPGLHDLLKGINTENERDGARELPKYTYPDCVVTSAAINYLTKHGIDFKVRREDAVFIRCLDAQKEKGSGLYGGGFILSERAAAERAAAERAAAERAAAERAAAERAAAERAAAHKWELSDREIILQRGIGSGRKG